MVLLLVFSVILGALTIAYHGHMTFLQGTFILPLGALVICSLVALLPRYKHHISRFLESRRPVFIARDWLPLILLAFVYENLHEYTSLLSGQAVDATLRHYDQRIFGLDLTTWIDQFVNRPLTEYMTFCYGLYFFFPTYLLFRVYMQNKTYLFREMSLTISICFYLSFVGYILVPAVGPRYFIPHEFVHALDGYWLTPRAAEAWNSFENVKTDCFPSQHTALSMISLIFYWRYRNLYREGRAVLWIFTPLIVSLWASTLYLRYHWGIDVIAGTFTAVFCCLAVRQFSRWYYPKMIPADPETAAQLRA